MTDTTATAQESMLTTGDVARRLRCSTRKVIDEARQHNIGINLRGPAGYRFTETDFQALLDVMRPKPVITPRRRRRRSA